MSKTDKEYSQRAEKLWDKRELPSLTKLCAVNGAAKVPEVWYFAGLAWNAQNDRRRAIESWRRAIELSPAYAAPTRALAYELVDADPLGAAELFNALVALQQADADDLTALAEIRIRQDRLREAHRLLEKALAQEEANSLALLAMATVYAQVRDRTLTLEFLRRVQKTSDIDIADLNDDPEFEFLWRDKEFEKITARST